jgi:hypothetical protein
MAINKNFVVKNGLEVNTQLIYADADTNNVGIASTQPRVELDVRGGIAASNTTVAGVTTVITELRVGTSGTVFTVLGIGNSVGVGTSQPAYLLDIRSPGTGTTALYVQGDMRVTGDINLDDINLDYAQIGSLLVTGISTFQDYIELEDGLEVTSGITTTRSLNVIGFSTLRANVDVAADVGITSSLIVGAGLSVSGISTFTGLVDVNGGIDVTGVSTFASNLDINSDVDINRSLTITGGSRVTGLSTFTGLVDVNGGLDVTGISTFSNNLDVNADIDVNQSVSITGGLGVSGIGTIGRVEIFNDGTGGIVTATSGIITYYGDGQFLQNIVLGVGIASTNPSTGYSEVVGYGATVLTFAGPGVSTAYPITVNAASGIATIHLEGGGGGGGFETDIFKDTYTVGVGGSSVFTTSQTYEAGYVDVYINGSKLTSSDFVETDSTTITLVSAAVQGDVVELVNFRSVAITGDFETQITKEEFTVTTASRTVFDLANTYTPGYIDVYLNGVKLTSSDYVETDSDTITLTTPATFEDIVQFVNFERRAISEYLPLWRVNETLGVTGIHTFTTVGIGTSIPTAFVDVYGGMTVRSGITTVENLKVVGSGIDLIDDIQLKLGTGLDATLEYDTVTSSVRLYANGTDVNLFADNFNFYTSVTDNALQIVQNGAVNLYYDNSKKFETTSNGVAVTGNLTASNGINITGIATISSNLDVNGANHDINGAIALDHVTVSGITTVSSNTIVGGSLDVNGTNHDINGAIALDHVTVSGIVTATAFVDDGTNLLTEINTKTSTGKAIAMAMVFG